MGIPFAIEEITIALGERSINIASEMPLFAPAIEKTGIEVVHETSANAVDLAVRAVEGMRVRKPNFIESLGALVVVSQSNSMRLPSMAFEIQDRCSLPKEILAFDINQGCSGFVQALQIAVSLISECKSVLIVCADNYRSKLDKNDRSTNAVFSDAATAIFVSDREDLQILGANHFSDGSGRRLLYQGIDANENAGHLHMSGSDVWMFTKRVVFNQISETLDKSGVSASEVGEYYLHQASDLVLNDLKIKIGEDARVPVEMKYIGNTVSSTIPILLENRLDRLKTQISVLSGFGVGLSVSSMVIGPLSSKIPGIEK
jgi:3-oxoacyl-[acyl-carrier-protein] synthase III